MRYEGELLALEAQCDESEARASGNSIEYEITAIATMTSDHDKFGRVLAIQVDDALISEEDRSNLRELIDEQNNLDEDFQGYPEAQIYLLWYFKSEVSADKSMVVEATLPCDYSYESTSAYVAIPPRNLTGSDRSEWIEVQVDRGCPKRKRDRFEVYKVLHRSANWLIQRVRRQEPLIAFNVEDWQMDLLEDAYLLRKHKQHLNEDIFSKNSAVRIELRATSPSSPNRSKSRWPDVVLNVFTRPDYFISYHEENFGMWFIEGSDEKGLAVLHIDGCLELTGLADKPISLPTNLMSINLNSDGYCCAWRDDYQSWCGYTIFDKKLAQKS